MTPSRPNVLQYGQRRQRFVLSRPAHARLALARADAVSHKGTERARTGRRSRRTFYGNSCFELMISWVYSLRDNCGLCRVARDDSPRMQRPGPGTGTQPRSLKRDATSTAGHTGIALKRGHCLATDPRRHNESPAHTWRACSLHSTTMPERASGIVLAARSHARCSPVTAS